MTRNGWYGNLKAGIIILLISVIPFIAGYQSMVLGFESFFWEESPGEIEKIKSYTETYTSGGPQHFLSAHYSYTFDGKEFESENVTIEGPYRTSLKGKRNRKHTEFEDATTITVYVNPNNPSQSTLMRGLTPNGIMPLIATVFFFTCGSLIIFAWYKMRTSKSGSEGH